MTTAITSRPDTSEMVVVHNVFRRNFGAVPALVRRVPAGDRVRAGVVVDFFADLSQGLHHHHTVEDEFMWPLLLDRAPLDEPLITRMEQQHHHIAGLSERAASQAQVFAAHGDPVRGGELAETVEALLTAMQEHLHDEETRILPLVEQVMTVAEWEAMGERARADIPRDRQLVFLGFILQGLSNEQQRAFLAEMPVPARLAWRLLGRRTFVKEYRRIFQADPD